MTDIEILLLSLVVTTFTWLCYLMGKLGNLEREIKEIKCQQALQKLTMQRRK